MITGNYSQLTDEEFDGILEELVAHMPAGTLLQIPGVYEVLAEYLNNEVLTAWEQKNPEKAFPDKENR